MMKFLFTSFLGKHIQPYLDYRKALNFRVPPQSYYAFQEFDHFLNSLQIGSFAQLDEGLAFRWMHAISGLSASTKNGRLKMLRSFFHYLMRLDLLAENPAERVAYLEVIPYKPYIYALKEIVQMLEAAARLKDRPRAEHQFVGWVLETLIYLLYACGLRLGEAVNLKIKDVDFEENTLSLWKTKFHKERLVPFAPATAARLKVYLAVRRRCTLPASPDDPFFCHAKGSYRTANIDELFRIHLRSCLDLPNGCRPRLHDLRHSFAVHRLYKWYQEGHNIMNKLPYLSTYMGHVDIQATQVYLTVTEALLREVDRRFQKGFESVTHKGLQNALRLP